MVLNSSEKASPPRAEGDAFFELFTIELFILLKKNSLNGAPADKNHSTIHLLKYKASTLNNQVTNMVCCMVPFIYSTVVLSIKGSSHVLSIHFMKVGNGYS